DYRSGTRRRRWRRRDRGVRHARGRRQGGALLHRPMSKAAAQGARAGKGSADAPDKSRRVTASNRLHSGRCPCYFRRMTTLEDIEKAVARLVPEQLAEFRAWFEGFDAAKFDAEIECHSRKGKLDCFAEQAVRDFRKGRAKEI